MHFTYKGKNNKGAIVKGTISAPSKTNALQILRDQGIFVISIQEKSSKDALGGIIQKFNRVSYSQVTEFTQQLSTMIVSGLTVIDSLTLVEKQMKNPAFKEIISQILTSVRGGDKLSKALSKHPKQFNSIYTTLIQAGEASGKLDEVLDHLSNTMERQRAFRSNIKTQMIYPVTVIIGMVSLSIFVMVYVVPQLTEMYDQFNVTLPITTRILIFISDALINYWWAILGGTIGFVAVVKRYLKTEQGTLVKDKVILKLPVWGSLQLDIVMAEFSQTLSLLIASGVSIIESLDIVADAVPNKQYTLNIHQITRKVERGVPMGKLFSADPLYPPIIGQMITVGEETGKIDETLMRVAKFFEQTANEKVKRLSLVMEPVILVILGIGVAFLMLSIVLPMYQLTQEF